MGIDLDSAVGQIIATAQQAAEVPEPKVISGPGYNKLAIASREADGELEYEFDELPQDEPRPEPLVIHTLTGLVDYVAANRDKLDLGAHMVHIVNHGRVDLISVLGGPFAKRSRVACAEFNTLIGGDAFAFGRFMKAEDFVISLQALFVDSGDRQGVLAAAGNMREEAVKQTLDDGVTQQVLAQNGVHLGKPMQVPNPVQLRPFRTFREVEQPESKFAFRVKGGGPGELPTCALFEADGGAWRLSAIENISNFLGAQFAAVEGFTGITIIS